MEIEISEESKNIVKKNYQINKKLNKWIQLLVLFYGKKPGEIIWILIVSFFPQKNISAICNNVNAVSIRKQKKVWISVKMLSCQNQNMIWVELYTYLSLRMVIDVKMILNFEMI